MQQTKTLTSNAVRPAGQQLQTLGVLRLCLMDCNGIWWGLFPDGIWCFHPLFANLTIKILMPVMVYKWVTERGFRAGHIFPGRGLVFSKVLSTIQLHQSFVRVSGCHMVPQPWYSQVTWKAVGAFCDLELWSECDPVQPLITGSGPWARSWLPPQREEGLRLLLFKWT